MIYPFLAAWLRNPKQMGAIAPSGEPLARAMAAQVPASARVVVELGPGTGAITRALLKRLPDPPRLLLVEKEPAMVAALARRYPAVEVLTGDAVQLERLLLRMGIEQVDVVVSSLPLLSMRPRVAVKILLQIFSVLGPEGSLVQYTYSLASPISSRLAARLGLSATRATVVLRNLPPASVWVYQYRDRSESVDGASISRNGTGAPNRAAVSHCAAVGALARAAVSACFNSASQAMSCFSASAR